MYSKKEEKKMKNKKKKIIAPILSLGILSGGTVMAAASCSNNDVPLIEVALEKVTVPTQGPTNYIQLTFSMDIPTLVSENIYIKAISGFAKIEKLYSKGNGVYEVVLSSVVGGEVTVGIMRPPVGYRITGSQNIVLTQEITINNISTHYRHDQSGYIQLTFSSDMRGLSIDNIVLQSDGHIINKDYLDSKSAGVYELSIMGVDKLVNTEISVSVVAPDYYYINNSEAETISFLPYESLNDISAEYNNDGTPYIKLTFSNDISGLNEDNLEFYAQEHLLQKGVLENKGNGVYTIPLTDTIKFNNMVIQVVVKSTASCYIDSLTTNTVSFPTFVSVATIKASFNSGAEGYIGFTLSEDIPEINGSNIDVTAEGYSVEKGKLEYMGKGTYELPILNSMEIGLNNMTVEFNNPQGYYIANSLSNVVQFPKYVPLQDIAAIYDNKGDGFLELSFSEDIDGLDEFFIELKADTFVKKDKLMSEGDGKYLLPIINALEFTRSVINVSVNSPDGYYVDNMAATEIIFAQHVANSAADYQSNRVVVYFDNDADDIFPAGSLASNYFSFTLENGDCEMPADATLNKTTGLFGR
jgi:hypothetical protein